MKTSTRGYIKVLKWEYWIYPLKVGSSKSRLNQELNRIGSDGWEMTAIRRCGPEAMEQQGVDSLIIFKRPKGYVYISALDGAPLDRPE